MKNFSSLLIPRKKKRRRRRGRRGLVNILKKLKPKSKYSNRPRKVMKYGTDDLFVSHAAGSPSITQMNTETKAENHISFSSPFKL